MFDKEKALEIGRTLKEVMVYPPESGRPEGLSDREYAVWLTIVCALDYLKDADKLWNSARACLKDEELRRLFSVPYIAMCPVEKLADKLKRSGMSIFHNKDAKHLRDIGGQLMSHQGDPRNIIIYSSYDAEAVRKRLQRFPLLRGPKLSLFWMRLMHDYVMPEFDISNIPIPVDTHIAQMTYRTGILKNRPSTMKATREEVQRVWNYVAKELDTYPCKFDEPLWIISKYWCNTTGCNDRCAIIEHCAKNEK